VISSRLAGGGGYGDPLDREPERVATDVANGLLSQERALDAYGVVVDEHGTVDREATRRARLRRREASS
jgi:N-methylhydantoinase B